MSSKERLRILQMIEEQTITPDEGMSLLEMVAQVGRGADSAEPSRLTDSPGWLYVNVIELKNNQSKVKLNIPLGLVEVSHRMGARFVPEMAEDDYAQLVTAAQNGKRGKLYDATSASGDERIVITVE